MVELGGVKKEKEKVEATDLDYKARVRLSNCVFVS